MRPSAAASGIGAAGAAGGAVGAPAVAVAARAAARLARRRCLAVMPSLLAAASDMLVVGTASTSAVSAHESNLVYNLCKDATPRASRAFMPHNLAAQPAPSLGYGL